MLVMPFFDRHQIVCGKLVSPEDVGSTEHGALGLLGRGSENRLAHHVAVRPSPNRHHVSLGVHDIAI